MAVLRPVKDISAFVSLFRPMGSSNSVGSPNLASFSKNKPGEMLEESSLLRKSK